MAIDRSLPWLVFPPAVDLANTIVSTPAGPVDLLTTEEQLAVWVAAEQGRIAHVSAAHGHLQELRDLRHAVHAVLHARADGRRMPAAAIETLNDVSRAVPVAPILRHDGTRFDEPAVAEPFATLKAVIGRSAIDVVAQERRALLICGAPSCGMLFVPDSARQTWCSSACGNRARVARHASRHRKQRSPRPTAR